MSIFPRMGQRTKIILPIRSNLSMYNDIPEHTEITTNTFIPSVEDGPTVIARYRNLTINAGATLTTATRCCGLVVVVDGDLNTHGNLSMTARGAYGEPNGGDHVIKNSLFPGNNVFYEIDIPATAEEIANFLQREKTRYHSLDELPAIYRPTLYACSPSGIPYTPADLGVIPFIGAAGGLPKIGNGNGNAGGNGLERRCGGGGSGGAYSESGAAASGAGSAGTCYSGGSGGGGMYGTFPAPTAGSPFGGKGGDAGGNNAGGGAGNPGGLWNGSSGFAGGNGTGGLLIIICTGRLLVTGTISANGSNGGSANNRGGGGGSGGGSINIFHSSLLIDGGSISANGGLGGSAGSYSGGKGGNGCVTLDQCNF